MIKKERGITLVSLIITILVMAIVASTAIYMSLDRFEINNVRKMKNDIELLEDKVSNYYIKYGVLPILRNDANEKIVYPSSALNFTRNSGDNTIYYVLDLEAISGISLNYGEEGYQQIKQSKTVNTTQDMDVYIINELTHTIYYVNGVELDDEIYHYLKVEESISDNIPPSSPEIKIISGTKNNSGIYTTNVEVEIISGKDSWSGIGGTEYSLDNGAIWIDIENGNNIITLSSNGTHTILARSFDNANNYSEEATLTIQINGGDTTPPSSPEIRVTSGTQNSAGIYTTFVTVEIIPGQDAESGIGGTEYSLDNGTTWNTYSDVFSILEDGTYTIKARSYDKASTPNYSEEANLTITIKILKTLASQITAKNYGDTITYSANGQTSWKIFYNDGTNVFIITSNVIDKDGEKDISNKSLSESLRCKASKYKLNCFTEMVGSTAVNARKTADLLDSTRDVFVNSSYADSAIGSPTYEMLIASWNEKHNSNISVSYSYTGYSDIAHDFSSDALYYDSGAGYLIASPSGWSENLMLIMKSSGKSDEATFEEWGGLWDKRIWSETCCMLKLRIER